MGSELTRPDAGFTLIEVAVVIALLSILSVGSILVLRGGATSDAGDRSALIAAHAALRHEAVLGGRPLALWLNAQGRQRQTWRPDRDPGQPWSDAGSRIPWNTPPVFDPNTPDLRIVVLPNGRGTPFQLRLARDVRCTAATWGAVTCTQ